MASSIAIPTLEQCGVYPPSIAAQLITVATAAKADIDGFGAAPNNDAKGTDIPNDSSTIAVAQGIWRIAQAATFSANRSHALSMTGATARKQMVLTRLDVSDYTWTITDAGPGTPTLFVFPAGAVGSILVQSDGTNWFLKDAGIKHAAASATIPGTMSAADFVKVSTTGYRTLTLADADFAAGQGTGADSNGTARTYNLGAALPAGAQLDGYMCWRKVAATGNTTLSATVGSTGAVSEIASAIDMMATAGYTEGTVGAKARLKPTAAQLLVTVTPDGGSKVSAATGELHVTVWYKDATGL
jgi:hypothetical protein